MAIYAIGDLHLSAGVDKSMDIFTGWKDYTQKLCNNWKRKIREEDTVVLAGDISWGMTLEEALADFQLIHSLPGSKIILKGNHDYWWNSHRKMMGFFSGHGLDSIHILHNNSYTVEGVNLCGSRGWLFENGQPHDEKIINREAIRIEASIKSAADPELESILFLHYPPVYGGQVLDPFLELMHRYGIKRCYYGHIHGIGHKAAIQGNAYGIDFFMISADFLEFDPVLVGR